MPSKLCPIFALLSTLVCVALAAYDDGFARNQMLVYAGAAYSSHPMDCLEVTSKDISVYRVESYMCGLEKCSGYTAIDHEHQAIIVAFKGSEGFIQVVLNNKNMFKDKIQFISGGKVSNYTYQIYSKIWSKKLEDGFYTLKNKYPSYKIWVTGHSLGGALASMCAAEMIKNGLIAASAVTLYTFGQPRTGDQTFAIGHDKLNMVSYRLTHRKDMIAHFPSESFEDYYHHLAEVWYDNEMDVGAPYVTCEQIDEDNHCSDQQLIILSIDDHINYFTHHVSKWGENGCTD